MKRGIIKRPSSSEDKRRVRAAQKLRELKKERDKSMRKYEAKLEKQLLHICEKIWLAPDKFTSDQKDFADRLAVEHGIEMPINYDCFYNFGRVFSKEEAERLTPIFNRYILKDKQSPDIVCAIMNCQVSGIMIKNKRDLAILFDMLCESGNVCREWKKVIEEQKLFYGKAGALSAKVISKALQLKKERISMMNNPNGDTKSEINTKNMLKEMHETIHLIK